MSISKTRIKSADIKQNDNTTRGRTKIKTLQIKEIKNSTATTKTSAIYDVPLSASLKKTNEYNKAKIKQLSSLRTNKPTTIAAASTTTSSTISTAATVTPSSSLTATTTATTTTILPQTNLLKTESFVPNLTNRPQKTIQRSLSTLSNTTFKKLNNQHVNINQLNIQHNAKIYTGKLPKVFKQPTILRRRPALRESNNRQRSKSTSSSSNSNSNRPTTASIAITATPLSRTPCTSPHSEVPVQQSNNICRIQRHNKEQEKLPDRINYDKRGLTAIPIFENETNLRLLSLQHNLINAFHIPKEQEQIQVKEENIAAGTETNAKEQTVNEHLSKRAELNILGSQASQQQQHFYGNKQRLSIPNVEQLQPQIPGQLIWPLPAPAIKNPITIGHYKLQRNQLSHRSINMNNYQMYNHKSNLQHPAQLRSSTHKSKSFISNLSLPLTKRSMQNQKSAFLKRTDGVGNLKSFDSSASNITTDSTQSTLLTTEIDEDSLLNDEQQERRHSNSQQSLAIKNNQLVINYGNVFKNLVFLDLYDNQIERISNLDGLETLTVLLLGKNRISDISGLSSLKNTLRVLDLHGNKLCSISNKINCLKELKSLNLAGNQIRLINHNDFMGLINLKELNLKRNKLKRINGFQHLIALERLWLCHNDLYKVDDMSTIAKAENLIEITIENNPLTLAGDCVSFLVSYLPKLQTLSQMPVTEQVRKAAMTWRKNKELSAANSGLSNKEVFNALRREEIISNARTNWELLRSQQIVQNTIKQKTDIKSNSDLEKNNNYEEFIKLPPIKCQQKQQQQQQPQHNKERSFSASSLGPNINSYSSCYSSQDEDDTRITTKTNKPPNNIDKPSSLLSSSSSVKSKKQIENIINHISSTDNNHQHQHQSSNSLSNCKITTPLELITPIKPTTSNCAPTLNLQFPMETNKVSGNQQNQTVTSTTTSISSSVTQMQTVTTATVSSSCLAGFSPASVTLTKRYMTGSLMRSQTIVGAVTGGSGIIGGFGGNGGGYTSGYMVKTNTVATANNIRCQSKLNPNVTTKTAAINTLQQTITTTTATTTTTQQLTIITTTSTTTTGYSIAGAIANNNANNNSLMASSMNANNSSLTLNINKTSFTGASNSITGIPANTTTTTTTTITTATTTTTGPCGGTSTKLTAIEREREQGGDYLIEICGRYLNIYGQGALRFIDKQWNSTKANDVHTLNFSYINFNNIASLLGRIKIRFVHAENFIFRETNINCLGQLNALAELQGISSLYIEEEGNPIIHKDLWRSYAIYRLSHWGLKILNNVEVSAEDIENANLTYKGLSDLILWSMPDAMLQPLLTRLHLDESCIASKLLPKEWLEKSDNKSLRLVVGKEALQWKKPTNPECFQLPTTQQVHLLYNQFCNGDTLNTNFYQISPVTDALTSANVALTTRERGKIYFTLMMENTCNAVEKLHKLEHIWPTILQNIIRNTLLDYSQLDNYIRNLMAEIMK